MELNKKKVLWRFVQEVVGDDTLALQSVLESFTKREDLLKEEKSINAKLSEGWVSIEA